MKKYIPQLFILLVISYLLFLIRPALLGELGGTFQAHTLPQEYVTFEKYMVSQNSFSRVLWIPSLERFGFYSPTHPAVSAEDMYQVASIAGVLNNLKRNTETFLQERSIKYIVVPYDAEGELFLKDRKYDGNLYKSTIAALQKIPWLQEIPGFGKIHVFELKDVKDHFWISNNQNTKVTYRVINPTKYQLTVSNAKKGDKIIFTDSFDSHWQITIDGQEVSAQPYENMLNSFILPRSGSYTMELFYTPQKWVDIGLVISLLTAISIGIYFLIKLIQVYFRKAA